MEAARFLTDFASREFKSRAQIFTAQPGPELPPREAARQILRKIFPGVRPIALTPAEGGAVSFIGYAAGASILAGLANVTMVVPPG